MIEPDLQESEENLKEMPFKNMVFDEVLPKSQELIEDVFGNYII